MIKMTIDLDTKEHKYDGNNDNCDSHDDDDADDAITITSYNYNK